ncbi:hypothetical protein ABID20_000270 [Rhizobium alvei]
MWSRLKKLLMGLVEAIDGPPTPPLHPPSGLSTAEQWDLLPPIKRGMQWDKEGRLWVHEIKRCPATGLRVRITRQAAG